MINLHLDNENPLAIPGISPDKMYYTDTSGNKWFTIYHLQNIRCLRPGDIIAYMTPYRHVDMEITSIGIVHSVGYGDICNICMCLGFNPNKDNELDTHFIVNNLMYYRYATADEIKTLINVIQEHEKLKYYLLPGGYSYMEKYAEYYNDDLSGRWSAYLNYGPDNFRRTYIRSMMNLAML